jgi:hypothetical protein
VGMSRTQFFEYLARARELGIVEDELQVVM